MTSNLAAVVEAAVVVAHWNPVEELRVADVDLGLFLAELRAGAAPVAEELAAMENVSRRRRRRHGCWILRRDGRPGGGENEIRQSKLRTRHARARAGKPH